MFETSLGRANKEALVKSLRAYKYVAPNATLAEALFLNRFWDWVCTYYPMWLAPNLITAMGFVSFMIGFFFMISKDPDWKQENPVGYECLAVTICCFLYQTFDGTDGKQARRTKSGSALGELFDHGVDAMTVALFVPIGFYPITSHFESWLTAAVLVASSSAFYMSNMTLLHTNRQTFNKIDAQEAQICVQLFHLICFFTGRELFATVVPIPEAYLTLVPETFRMDLADGGISFGILFTLYGIFCPASNAIHAIYTVSKHTFEQKRANPEAAFEVGRGLSAWILQIGSLFVYHCLIVLSWLFVCQLRSTAEDVTLITCFFLFYMITFGDLMNHTLVTRVAKLPFPTPQRNRALGFCLLFNAVLGASVLLELDNDVAFAARWTTVIVAIGSNVQYCHMMGKAITEALNVNFFTIKHPPSAKTS